MAGVEDGRSYVNFDLLIEREAGAYRARVVSSPSGEAESTFASPFTSEELQELAARLDNSRAAARKLSAPQLMAAKEAGARLFRAVMTPELKASLDRAVDVAERQGATGARLRLNLDSAPELAVLPWELLYDPDPRISRFLALSEQTPLVRYMRLPEAVRPLTVALPIRVLVVAPAPATASYAELDLEREWRRLQDAMAEQISSGDVVFTRLPHATLPAVQNELALRGHHILHFMGHGVFDPEQQDGMLLFEAERGRAQLVSAETLATVLHNARMLRLVVINACEGARGSSDDPYAGTAQTLIRMGVPAVIGMQFEISDDAAIAFARQLYWAIAHGWPLDAAVTSARIALVARGDQVEWANAVLYMRASDGRIFDVTEPARSPTSGATEPRAGPVAAATDVATGPAARAAPEQGQVISISPRAIAAERTSDTEERPGYVEALVGALAGDLIVAAALLLSVGTRSWPPDRWAVLDATNDPVAALGLLFAPAIGAFVALRSRGLRRPWATAVVVLLLTVAPLVPLFAAWTNDRDGAPSPFEMLEITMVVATVAAFAARALVRWADRTFLAGR